MRQYRDLNHLPPMSDGKDTLKVINKAKKKNFDDLEFLSREELIDEAIKARVETERAKKRLCCQRRWSGKGIHQFKQFEFEIIYKLSNDFPVQKLCKIMDVNRSGFYKWRNRMNNVSSKKLNKQ